MHERSDIDTRIIVGFGAALALAAALILVLVWLLFGVYGNLNAVAYPREFPMVQSGQLRLPPAPRLQDTPRADLKKFLREEDAVLGGYTWIDKQTGAVRLPIDRAMQRVLDQGLPTRDNPPADQGGRPSKASSGR
jgi:hypothetical protein